MRQLKRLSFALAYLALVAPVAPVAAVAAEAPPTARVKVKEGFTTTPDGVRLYYRIAGSGDPVVIAPFALFHRKALDPLARGRRVVTYDPRGRGKSQAVAPDKISLDHLLIDLDTVRRAVGAEKTAIIGWSGAGMETFVYALRNPGRVTRLVQLAPVTARAEPFTMEMMTDRRRRTDAAAAAALKAKVDAGEFRTDPAAHCRAENRVSFPALLADPADLSLIPDVCGNANEHPSSLGAYFGTLWPHISKFDWRSSLVKVTIPRLVVYPLQDNITRAGVEEWVRGQPNARVIYIDRSGHLPQYEQPELTIAAIDRFLSGKWPSKARSLP